MSIETEIQALTAAVQALTAAIAGGAAAPKPAKAPKAEKVEAPAPVAAPMPAIPFPATPTGAAPQPTAPAVPNFLQPPAPPSFMPPAASARPFNDVQGACSWVVERFKALGPRGTEIQGVLASMGITNIAAVQPSQFDDLYARVSALG
jgi:hypothetical protein